MASKKILIVFEIEKVFCYSQRILSQFRKNNSYIQQIGSPEKLENRYKVTYRPGYEDLLKFLFLQGKDTFEVGVWSSLSRDECVELCNLIFRKHMPSLLFITASKNPEMTKNILTEEVNICPIEKNLNAIREQFPEFTLQNMACVSPFKNLVSDQAINDIIVDQYDKKKLGVGFSNDYYMTSLYRQLVGMREVWRTNRTQDIRRYLGQVNYKIVHEKMAKAVTGDVQWN